MHDHQFLGVGTVGERGQVSIPADARKHIAIKTGEKLVFFSVGDVGFMVIKADSIDRMFSDLVKRTKAIKSVLRKGLRGK